MYYQINVTMERKKYEEKPPVVVLDRICEQAFTTVNFGIMEFEGAYEAISATLTGEKSAEEVVSQLDDCGMIGELKPSELAEIIRVLKCEDEKGLMDKFADMQQAVYAKEVEEKVRNRYMMSGIRKEINRFGLTAKEALAVQSFYPEWMTGIEVKKGERYQSEKLLWECLKDHTTQESWKPSVSTASLWKVVEPEHEGTERDPVPYNPPMELFKDKFYTQNGVKYKCTRDSGGPLTHDLSELVGIYVELVK